MSYKGSLERASVQRKRWVSVLSEGTWILVAPICIGSLSFCQEHFQKGFSECVREVISDVFGFHGCWLACDTWTVFRYFLYKYAFQNMSWKGGCMEVAKKRYDDKTRFEAVAFGSCCSVIIFSCQ